MSKTLIVFFSLKGETYVNGHIENRPVGNTEVIGRKIQASVGGDLFHIEAVNPYPKDHMQVIDVAKEELRTHARPKLKAKVADMTQYDAIILGYPNWWGTIPMAVCTFLESYDFSGKTIIPYCTHEGSGLGRSVQDIKDLCPDAEVTAGTAIRGGSVAYADREVEQIVKQINKH